MWIKENWFKIVIVILIGIAFSLWNRSIKNDVIRDYVSCHQNQPRDTVDEFCPREYLGLLKNY
jgi:hypothetical protein